MATQTTAAARSRKDPYLGRVVAGRYRLETRLGEGGMGVVYRARHVLIDRVVVLKLIRPDLQKETHLRAWMLREARAANRVDHAHIVDIYDVGETEQGELYLVMEYLTGVALSNAIAKGPMPVTRAVDILEQMTAALARAHDLGVVHRDLKADNIMLTMKGGRHDFVKILDFGLAALARDSRLAPKGAVFGTPEYMSPEQARGEDANASSDLYALGILFYEMMTGQLPFKSADRDTLLEMQRSAPATSTRTLRPDIPAHADEICLKLLEKDPAARFRDGHHLKEELKALQRSLPSTAWEVGAPEAPAAPPPPPPAPSPGVVEWSHRAAQFLRAMSRAYPNGRAPEKVRDAADHMWDLAARAARLEGELASHSKKLEAIEKRGRALRAEIGRKVEELAGEESRASREAAAQTERGDALEHERRRVVEAIAAATAQARAAAGSASGPVLRKLGSLEGRAAVLERVRDDYAGRAAERQAYADGLRSQIDDHKKQLQRYSEALESDLAAGRDGIATRVRQALSYEQQFVESSALLLEHLKTRPECRDLLEDIIEEGPTRREPRHPSSL